MRLVAVGFPLGFERRKPDFSKVAGQIATVPK